MIVIIAMIMILITLVTVIIISINNNVMFSFRGGWTLCVVGCGSCDVYRRCGSVLELIVSVLLCPVLDTPSPWNEGRERLLDELGEGFIQVIKSIALLTFILKTPSAFVIHV